MTESSELGSKITAARRALGIKQYDLAKLVGISIQYMNQIENDKVPVDSIGADILKRIFKHIQLEEEIQPEKKSSGINEDEKKSTENNAELVSVFEAEKKGWLKLEASLRDTIKRQEQTIEFLMSLHQKSKDT